MEIPRHWRLKAQRYRLEGSICPICGQPTFPPRPACAQRHCASTSAPTAGGGGSLLPTLYRALDAVLLKGIYDESDAYKLRLIDYESRQQTDLLHDPVPGRP